jgi:hypothetical protein
MENFCISIYPENKKQKICCMEAWAIFLYLFTFAHRASGSLLFVCLLVMKRMEVIHLQTD